MEVSREGPAGHGNDRRKRDTADGGDRRLDWSVRDNDILLLPLSPCSLDDVLGRRGQCIHLQPVPDTLDPDSLERALDNPPDPALRPDAGSADSDAGPARHDAVTSVTRSVPAQLTTWHRAAELQRLCRQVLVENALVKQRGQRTLFLVAGFIDLPVTESDGRRRRAPLLCYPVILARRVEAEADQPAKSAGTPDAGQTAARGSSPESGMSAGASVESGTSSSAAANRDDGSGTGANRDSGTGMHTGPASRSGKPHAPTDDPIPLRPDDVAPARPLAYELRMDSEAPEANTALAEQCARLFGIELPVKSEAESLKQYFSRVAQVLSSCDDVHLSMEMALGSCRAAVPADNRLDDVRLPDVPAGFIPSLARELLDGSAPDTIDLLLDLLDEGSLLPPGDAGSAMAAVSPATDTGAGEQRDRLHDFSIRLVEHEIGHIEFSRLPSLPRDLDRWSSSIRACLRTPLFTEVLDATVITGRQLVRLASIIELLDKAPNALADFAHRDLCYRATPGLLQRARHQARLIEDEMQASRSWFCLEKLPPRHRLLQLMDELESAIDRDPELVGASYFSARRQFMEFSVDKPTQVDAEHLDRLREVIKLLRFRELFIHNPEYRLALGPGYRGLRTDWSALAKSAGYARELAESMGSELLAGQALTQWSRFRQTFVSELATLQRAADHLRKLLLALGARWQVETVEQILLRARETMVPLAALLNEYGDTARQAAEAAPSMATTPTELLALKGQPGGSLAAGNRLAARVRARLQESLASDGLSSDNIIDTLNWLRAASRQLREQSSGNPGERLARLVQRLQSLE